MVGDSIICGPFFSKNLVTIVGQLVRTPYALLKYFENLHIFLHFNCYEVNFANAQ